MTTEETLDSAGHGIELALPGDTIRKRHIATRASNRRKIIVLVVGDSDFEGYSIGLDSHSLQILELPSGEVSSIALEYIVAITDSTPFSDLTREQKDIVDRRTASFKKTSHTWLVKNWPDVYDRRDEEPSGSFQNRMRPNRRPTMRASATYVGADEIRPAPEGTASDGDS